MTVYAARNGASVYGASVGVIHVPVNIPLIPGDVGNASTFRYPVVYETIDGCSLDELVDGDEAAMAAHVIDAARRLEATGVRVIGADCGTLIRYQRVVAAAVRVPVLLSPLLVAPLLCAMLGENRTVAVLAASDRRITSESLARAGVSDGSRVFVCGLQDRPAFRSAIVEESGNLDSEAIEREIVETGRELVAAHADLGAFLLECADLPPYAAALQGATGLPVFDMVSLLDHAFGATHHQRPTGVY